MGFETVLTSEKGIRSRDLLKWFISLSPADQRAALRVNQWGFRDRPSDWIRHFIDWVRVRREPAKYQLDIPKLLVRNPAHRVAVRSPHGVGKTALASMLVWWFFCTRDGFVDWKIVTTAGSWTQLTHYLWPEIHKWGKYVRWDLVGRDMPGNRELMSLSLRGQTGEAFAVSTNDVDLIEGAHAQHLMYLFDEAKAIPASIWDGAEGAFANAGEETEFEGYAFAISTAGPAEGRFFEIFQHRDRYKIWWTYHITRDKAIAAGMMSPEWAEARRREWGEDSALYKNKVLGQFANVESNVVVALHWVEMANARWERARERKHTRITSVGVDVAWTGGDKSVITVVWDGYFVDNQVVIWGDDPMQVVGRVIQVVEQDKSIPITVDVIGIGAGVVARLMELGYNVISFNGSERTTEVDEEGQFGFVNRRSASWWRLREWLDPSKKPTLALPPDEHLVADITTPRWWVSSAGRIMVEPKDQFKTRLGRSPDHGDSLVYALVGESPPVGIV